MTNFKPMLFSTDMVKAILNGTKTQTRRIVKYNKKIESPNIGFSVFSEDNEFEVRGVHENGQFGSSFFKKPINKGDIIWVRETFAEYQTGIIYKADEKYNGIVDNDICKWKPSLFMKKEVCRLFLEVTNIRIEKLNIISDSDSIEEGIEFSNEFGYKLYSKKPFFSKHLSASDSYMSLWELINGQGSWKENPFVWVYTFKVVGRPQNFC